MGRGQKSFQFSFMVFGLRVEKWRDRKYSLYKFTFTPLINKKKITNQKKKMDEPKKKKNTNRMKIIKKDKKKKTKEELI